MQVRCPAKVNPFLSVGPRDATGMHPVRTVLQAVGLCDTLTVEASQSDTVDCDWPELPAENTMTKALRLLRELVPVPPLSIRLEKRIPAQAGLGGGSSDAAGVIRAAQRLCPDMIEDRFAREVAFAVGADVPFFLVGGRAKATGYGEELTPLPDLPKSWIMIVKPSASVSTAAAYSALDESPREWREFSDEPYNDFERVAPCMCGEVAERLRVHGATSALLCGSGSAVYGAFASESEAEAAKQNVLQERLGECWVVPTLTREECLWTS